MILLQLALIALNAIFACAEIAVISVSEARLDILVEEGNKNAKKLRRLTKQPARFLATIQVAITLSGFLGSAFAADNFAGMIVTLVRDTWGITSIPENLLNSICVILITLILSFFTLVFGELVPKRVAQRKSEEIALKIAPLVSGIAKVFGPLVSLLTHSTNGILRLMHIDPNATDEEVSEEDIRMMAEAGSKKGLIDEDENEVIQNVFEFDDLTAGEISTHRKEVTLLWMEESDEEWNATIQSSRHTMYPICDDSADNIVGILNTKDYFRLENQSREEILEKAVRPAYFVPESVTADVLLRNMKKERTTFAVVLDEYGGMEGIVTLTDLIERLVGDLVIVDDDPEEEPVSVIEKLEDENAWRIRGEARIDEIERELEIDLPDCDFDTFNGLVFSQLEEIPEEGASFEVEIEIAPIKLIAKVNKIVDHQVDDANVVLLRMTSDNDEDEEADDNKQADSTAEEKTEEA
ncbi:MAG: HlyC/CorC family transporter [Ruminococcaceae bacterium]|nr:HlyC/CorC family transporter [Oscillospiraceae bacterium]